MGKMTASIQMKIDIYLMRDGIEVKTISMSKLEVVSYFNILKSTYIYIKI